jgi:hypothetical protein
LKLRKKEQTYVFCGKPFMIANKNEIKLLSVPGSVPKNLARVIPEQRKPIDVNQAKPVNKNKRKPLR